MFRHDRKRVLSLMMEGSLKEMTPLTPTGLHANECGDGKKSVKVAVLSHQ